MSATDTQVELNMLKVVEHIGRHRVGLEPAVAEGGAIKKPREQATQRQTSRCSFVIIRTLSISNDFNHKKYIEKR